MQNHSVSTEFGKFSVAIECENILKIVNNKFCRMGGKTFLNFKFVLSKRLFYYEAIY